MILNIYTLTFYIYCIYYFIIICFLFLKYFSFGFFEYFSYLGYQFLVWFVVFKYFLYCVDWYLLNKETICLLQCHFSIFALASNGFWFWGVCLFHFIFFKGYWRVLSIPMTKNCFVISFSWLQILWEVAIYAYSSAYWCTMVSVPFIENVAILQCAISALTLKIYWL